MAPKAILTYIILNTSRKHVNYEEDKNKGPMNKPYNIQNTNICNGIFHISFFEALFDVYRVNLKNDPRCVCGNLFEDAIHFFLECPLYQHDRTSLYDSFPIANIVK
jgi:hypothetical protein